MAKLAKKVSRHKDNHKKLRKRSRYESESSDSDSKQETGLHDQGEHGEQLDNSNSERCKRQAFGISEEFKELLGIKCSTKSSKNKSKGPKLPFNQSVYSLTINFMQTNNSYKQCYMRTKDIV